MKLVLRFLRFLALIIVNFLFNLAATTLRLVLLPFLMVVLRLFRDLVSLSFRAAVNGPTRFIDRLAGEWTQRVLDLVDDREHIHAVYQICRILVGGLIALGWIIAGLFTVEILRVVFGIFI